MPITPPAPPSHLAAFVAALLVQIAGAHAAEPAPVYQLAAPALNLATNEADFAPLARRVWADVDSALRAATPPDPARLKLLLGIRVHLALLFRDDAAALDAAARIRALQTDPAERAHAGLTTRALIAAGPDPRAFEREFTRLLATLPHDPALVAVLRRARERIAATTEAALLDEVRRNIAPHLARGEPCTLEIADQLIRIRHRLTGILPLRDAMLRAYDSALAAQE
jgi:hypothetical protein